MTPTIVLVGALSVYAPGDGHNGGTLACGGKLTWQSTHIAIRAWRRVGCGAVAKVCVYGKDRLAMRRVRQGDRARGVNHVQRMPGSFVPGHAVADTMPQRGRRRNLQPLLGLASRRRAILHVPRIQASCIWTTVEDSGPWGIQCGQRWRVWTKYRIPRGCRRRAVVDLSWALWVALGKPRFLTRVKVEVYR